MVLENIQYSIFKLRRVYRTFVLILEINVPLMQNRNYDLEDRLVDYTCRMIDVVETLPNTRAGNYIAVQLVKSCHSPTFNYSDAQAVESTKDFIH